MSNTLGISMYPIQIYEDNISCIMMTNTYECKCNKHTDVKHYFVKDLVSRGIIRIDYILTTEQIADVFTEALPAQKFIKFRDQCMLNKIS